MEKIPYFNTLVDKTRFLNQKNYEVIYCLVNQI